MRRIRWRKEARQKGGGAWSTVHIVLYCDETWNPLLDQGLVEASGLIVSLTFALKGKAR
jgi:hypothetical protein